MAIPGKRGANEMGIELARGTDGKWLKIVDGKAIEATADEVALWKAAQARHSKEEKESSENAEEKAAQSEEEPKSTWDRMMDMAKWAGVAVTAATFLVLWLDWMILLGFYTELGISGVALEGFKQQPVHPQGVLLLFLYCFFGISIYILKFNILRYIFYTFFGILIILLGLQYFSLYIILSECYQISLIQVLLIFCSLALTIYALTTVDSRLKKIFISLAIGFILFAPLPFSLGRESAKPRPCAANTWSPVILTAERAIPLSNQVRVHEVSEDVWLYMPRATFAADSDRRDFSLQHIGTYDGTVYLFDTGSTLVHRLPEEAVLHMITLPKSRKQFLEREQMPVEDSLYLSNYWQKPRLREGTPTPRPFPPR